MHTHPHPQTQLVLACIARLWLERVWLCKTNPQEVGGTFVSTVFRFAMKLGDPILVPRHGESMGTRLGWTLANRHGVSMMWIHRQCVVWGYFQLCVCTLSVLIPICLAYFLHPFLPLPSPIRTSLPPPSPLPNLHTPAMATYSITGTDHVFLLNGSNNEPCFYASFLLNFTIYYHQENDSEPVSHTFGSHR